LSVFLLVVIAVALFGALLIVGLAVGLGQMVGKGATKQTGTTTGQRLAGQDILLSTEANCFGLESAGVTQTRGIGTLTLTATELVFVGAASRDVLVPRSSIIGVTEPNSHLGKTQATPLLHVRFRTPTGEDSVAWRVPDLSQWRHALQPANPLIG
jgi:hypothetical protein